LVIPVPNIKPVSDLRNYGEILRDVAVGQPVFLTKNGHGRYAVLDMEEYKEYEKMKAAYQLMMELERGRLSGEQDGWIPMDEAFRDIEARSHG
jgi:prevent-host-death family protein